MRLSGKADGMSQVSWIAATNQALRSAVDVVEGQRQMENLRDAAADLPDLISSFRALAEAASILRPLGWDGRGLNPEVRESLRNATEALDTRAIRSSVRGLAQFQASVKSDLTEFWRQYAAERLGNVGDLQILATTLKEVDGFARHSERLEAALGALARTQDALPDSRSMALLREAETALQELEESLRPEVVRVFLVAVARGGAPLDRFGPEVLDWLKSHNALGRFRIVAGQPSEA